MSPAAEKKVKPQNKWPATAVHKQRLRTEHSRLLKKSMRLLYKQRAVDNELDAIARQLISVDIHVHDYQSNDDGHLRQFVLHPKTAENTVCLSVAGIEYEGEVIKLTANGNISIRQTTRAGGTNDWTIHKDVIAPGLDVIVDGARCDVTSLYEPLPN